MHEMDIARWGLGVSLPTRITTSGAHVMFDDMQNTPNLLMAQFELPNPEGAGEKKRMLQFEVRHWDHNPEGVKVDVDDNEKDMTYDWLGRRLTMELLHDPLEASPNSYTFTYDANGLVDDFGGSAHAWAELGVRSPCYVDFNPTWQVEGAGVWLATDYHWTANTFDPDPPGSPTLDLDDKLILQKGGGLGEGSYNLPSTPPNPWANHAVWFDRDGVDQWQAQMWGAIDGVTYNTAGTYDVHTAGEDWSFSESMTVKDAIPTAAVTTEWPVSSFQSALPNVVLARGQKIAQMKP